MRGSGMAPEKSKSREDPFDAQTRMAADRTFLAYVRTGLAMISLGFVIARFNVFLWKIREAGQTLPPSAPRLPLWIGSVLAAYGVAVNMFATVQHRLLLRRADRGEPYRPPTWSPDLVVGIGMALLGILVLVVLFTAR